jgi:hypothetical protein
MERAPEKQVPDSGTQRDVDVAIMRIERLEGLGVPARDGNRERAVESPDLLTPNAVARKSGKRFRIDE